MSALIHPLTDPTLTRDVTITRVFQDGVELNWLPPTEPNGEVHYVIYYTPEGGTEQSIDTGSDLTHYNLTGLERNRVYTIIAVQAVNSAGRSERSDVTGSAVFVLYSHNIESGEQTLQCPTMNISVTYNYIDYTNLLCPHCQQLHLQMALLLLEVQVRSSYCIHMYTGVYMMYTLIQLFHSSHQQPPPPSCCFPGCGSPAPHHLCGSTGTCSSSDCQQTEQCVGRERSH